MNNDVQYEIYIGCFDQQTKKEVIRINELLKTVNDYFSKQKINYSVKVVEGGYKHSDGVFAFEKTLCITIIGDQNFDAIKFSKVLSMYMNQECFMITKEKVLKEYK